MIYPQNGSVVLIDDKFEEVEGLIRVLSKEKVSSIYFNEDLTNIEPIIGTRLVFLDLNLNIDGQDKTQEDVNKNVFAVLRKLIEKNNGGYILILWSSMINNYAPYVKSKIQKAKDENAPLLKEYPIEILEINKSDVATKKDNTWEFNLEKIRTKLESLIDKNSIINFFISWENIILNSGKQVINNFDKIAHTEEQKKDILTVFADSISNSDHLTKDNILTASINPFSSLLTDQILSDSNNLELHEISQELSSKLQDIKKLNIDQVSKINKFYHIDEIQHCTKLPGSIYRYQDFHKDSCSSNNCSTKWTEDLEEKIRKKFMASDIDKVVTTKFNNNVKNLTKQLIPDFQKNKSFKESIESIFTTEDDIVTKIQQYIPDFQLEDDETKKRQNLKTYIEKRNDPIENNIIKKQINFITSTFSIKENEFINEEFSLKSFKQKREHLKQYYKSKMISKENYKDSWKKRTPIFLEFSPDCDYVQNKRKKLRLIFGFLYPYNYYTYGNKIFNGDNFIYTPIFEYNNKPYRIVLDLHTVTGINDEILENKNITETLFRLRKELVVDIQQKIATHISRPGFFNMDDYLN